MCTSKHERYKNYDSTITIPLLHTHVCAHTQGERKMYAQRKNIKMLSTIFPLNEFLLSSFCYTSLHRTHFTILKKWIILWFLNIPYHLTKKDTQMASRRMKRVGSTSHVIRKLQIKTRYPYTSIITAIMQNTDNTKCCQRCGGTGILINCW